MRLGDAAAICAYRSLPTVAQYQSWTTYTPADAARLIASQADLAPNSPGTWLQLAITTVADESLIGDCGIHFLAQDDQQVELGVTMSPSHCGQGLATEALTSVLQYVFGQLNKHRASAVTDAENQPAAKLLRRLGFRCEAHFVEHIWFKGKWGSEFVFALLRREWYANQKVAR